MAKARNPTEKPKALDTLVEITETALDFRHLSLRAAASMRERR